MREAAVLANLLSGRMSRQRIAATHQPACDGRPVMLLPGFLSSPGAMGVLHDVLARTGYKVRDWGMGRNMGARRDTLERLAEQIDAMAQHHGAPVTLIGWSLGGVYAREAAKNSPDIIRSVMTLGAPFSGDLRANNAWRIYEHVAGHPVDAPPVAVNTREKPPVPTIAFWSRRDGIVSPVSARGEHNERDAAIELDCGHLGFASKPSAVSAILSALSGAA
ncbi:MAG: alpha/beta hydrolase [Pseudomonadota bacterium]